MLISNNARQTDRVVTKLHFIKNIAIGSQAAGYVGRLDSSGALGRLDSSGALGRLDSSGPQ
jgi:hypothetical protein